jgi:hypothetical protein
MTNRMKIFDVPHKGLRNALSQFSLQAGNTHYQDAAAVAALHQFGQQVFSLLSIHAHDENNVTLNHLEERLPGAAHHNMDDHEVLEAKQQLLEDALDAMLQSSQQGKDISADGAAFYSNLNDYHALYLQHMAEEEKDTQPLLWQYFTDEELLQHRKQIMANNPPQTLFTWFRFVMPAQSHIERVSLLKGFKLNAPPAFFAEGMQVIKQVLVPKAYEMLENALAV